MIEDYRRKMSRSAAREHDRTVWMMLLGAALAGAVLLVVTLG